MYALGVSSAMEYRGAYRQHGGGRAFEIMTSGGLGLRWYSGRNRNVQDGKAETRVMDCEKHLEGGEICLLSAKNTTKSRCIGLRSEK